MPLAGPFVALFTPGYDEDGSAQALEEIKRTNAEVRNVANGLSNLTALVAQTERMRVASERSLAAANDRNAENIQLVKEGLTAGITAIAKVGIQNQAGISVARAESVFLNILGKQDRLVQEISVNGLAQKLLKYAMLCPDDPSLCLDTSEDSVTFYVTSWLYAWRRVGETAYTTQGLFSKITVYRRPSAFSYLVPGDAWFYRYTVEPLIMGEQSARDASCPLGNVQSCSSDYISACRSYSACYWSSINEYVAPTQFNPFWSSRQIPGSAPFNNDISIDGGGHPYPGSGPQDSCGGYQGNLTCCGSVCVECQNYTEGIARSCDPRLDVIGARPSTVWMPPGIVDTSIRTMESMGGNSVPLHSPVYAANRARNIFINGTYIPYAADFVNPYQLAFQMFQPRFVVMSPRLAELVASANGQDNSAMALPGPMIEVRVGMIEGSTVHVVMDPTLFYASAAIIGWATGNAPYMGWIPQTGCRLEAEGMCCAAVLPGPVVSSIPFIQQQITSLLPEQYKARNMYESIVTLQGLAGILNLSFSRMVFFNESAEIARLNNGSEAVLRGLEGIQGDMAGVVQRSNDRDVAIQAAIDDVNSRNSGSGGFDSSILLWGLSILSLVTTTGVCAFVCWRNK